MLRRSSLRSDISSTSLGGSFSWISQSNRNLNRYLKYLSYTCHMSPFFRCANQVHLRRTLCLTICSLPKLSTIQELSRTTPSSTPQIRSMQSFVPRPLRRPATGFAKLAESCDGNELPSVSMALRGSGDSRRPVSNPHAGGTPGSWEPTWFTYISPSLASLVMFGFPELGV